MVLFIVVARLAPEKNKMIPGRGEVKKKREKDKELMALLFQRQITLWAFVASYSAPT